MTYEEAIREQVNNGRGISKIDNMYKVECMINRHRYYLGMYEDLDEAIETLYNFRVAYLEDQIETAGFNIQDGMIVQDNYILFLPNFIFTLYGKPLAINVNQYGVEYARVNNTTIGFRKN